MMQQENLDINFINFNQDCSSLAIGTKTGYKLYSLNSVDKLDIIYESACRLGSSQIKDKTPINPLIIGM